MTEQIPSPEEVKQRIKSFLHLGGDSKDNLNELRIDLDKMIVYFTREAHRPLSAAAFERLLKKELHEKVLKKELPLEPKLFDRVCDYIEKLSWFLHIKKLEQDRDITQPVREERVKAYQKALEDEGNALRMMRDRADHLRRRYGNLHGG